MIITGQKVIIVFQAKTKETKVRIRERHSDTYSDVDYDIMCKKLSNFLGYNKTRDFTAGQMTIALHHHTVIVNNRDINIK